MTDNRFRSLDVSCHQRANDTIAARATAPFDHAAVTHDLAFLLDHDTLLGKRVPSGQDRLPIDGKPLMLESQYFRHILRTHIATSALGADRAVRHGLALEVVHRRDLDKIEIPVNPFRNERG